VSDFDVEKLRLPPEYIERIERKEAKAARRQAASQQDHIVGAPKWWVHATYPVCESKAQFAVAMYLWRRFVICGRRNTFDFPNGELDALNITRQAKYRTLKRLAAAGLIQVAPQSTGKALLVTIFKKKPKGPTNA
jgi:hypothetical protein